MNARNQHSPVAKNQKALKIVWFALLIAIFAYTAVVLVFASPEPPEIKESLRIAFLLVAAALGIVSFLIYRFNLCDKSLRKRFTRIQSLEAEKRLEELSSGFLLPHVIPWGINECIVLTGFILAFITKEPESIIPFSVTATLLHLYMYPRLDELVRKTEKWS